MNDPTPLSERELDVLKLVATGATNQQIARALFISPNTVKVHLRNIFEKLGVQSRTEATMEAVRCGWVGVNGVESPVGGAAAGEAESVARRVPPPLTDPLSAVRPARHPLLAWQRVYLGLMVVLALAAFLSPRWLRTRTATVPVTLFSDAGRPAAAALPRVAAARWTALAALPAGRSRLALAATGGKLYAIGGETGQGVTGETWIYDPRSNGWLPGPDKPTAVANVGAAVVGKLLCVPGGTTAGGAITAVLECLDGDAATWQTRAPLPVPVAAYALAAIGDRLYLFGGWDGAALRDETWVYDAAEDRWTTGIALPGPRAFAAAATLGGQIYVAGGYDGAQALADTLRYDPADGGWTPQAAMSVPRAGLGLAALGSRLYAVGGSWDEPLASNEQYEAQVDAWSSIGSPVSGLWRHLGVVGLDQQIHAVGGWGGAYLAQHEQYQALIRQLLPLGSKGG